jgi:hypothetical protein
MGGGGCGGEHWAQWGAGTRTDSSVITNPVSSSISLAATPLNFPLPSSMPGPQRIDTYDTCVGNFPAPTLKPLIHVFTCVLA